MWSWRFLIRSLALQPAFISCVGSLSSSSLQFVSLPAVCNIMTSWRDLILNLSSWSHPVCLQQILEHVQLKEYKERGPNEQKTEHSLEGKWWTLSFCAIVAIVEVIQCKLMMTNIFQYPWRGRVIRLWTPCHELWLSITPDILIMTLSIWVIIDKLQLKGSHPSSQK